MGWNSKDVYYNPEHFGLEVVGMAEQDDMSYEFNMFGVWKDGNGVDGNGLYYASDSGCSCPSPFEEYTSVESLTKAKTVSEVHEALDEWAKGAYGWRENAPNQQTAAGVADLHAKLASL